MKDLFERSVPMQETAQTKKGLLWILELLVFVAVFLVASIAHELPQCQCSWLCCFPTKPIWRRLQVEMLQN